jgi:hypothetical protein
MPNYGLMYANTSNLGDDIQALAAKQFLPHVNHYIERDSINDFKKESNVKTILNGWWTHNKNAWPPPKNIIPLLISMHINEDASNTFLSKKAVDYCKNLDFGARDIWTLKFLKNNGFKNSYLSYCLTLTFPPYRGPRNNNILFVDALSCKSTQQNQLSHFMKNLHNLKPQERLIIAQERLDLYKKAKLVVTSRLHCALPCIAFGTPVLFQMPNIWPQRISGYKKILSYKEDFKIIKSKLIEKCINFIKK